MLEQKETIDAPLLQQISAALKIQVEAIQNFDEEQIIIVISNTINNNDNATMTNPAIFNFHPSLNPIEKMIELYERIFQQQKEMIEKLERLIEKKYFFFLPIC